MPNWCSNTLTMTHSDPAEIQRAVEAFKKGRFLDEFIPVPSDLKSDGAETYGEDSAAEHEALRESNQAKHGYQSWYDFCVSEWGTKWDVGGDGYDPSVSDDGCTVTVSFDSAWSPPIAAYEKLTELGFQIDAKYYEPGVAFAGSWYDGCDDFYEIGGMSADEVEELLPSDLDEEFAISETMREYEDEEPLTEWYIEGVKEKGLDK